MQKVLSVLGVAVLSGALSAQWTFSDTTAANDYLNIMGPTTGSKLHVLDAQALASGTGTGKVGYTANGGLGMTKDNLLGHIWVTFRQNTAARTTPHKLVEYWWDPTASSGAGAWHTEVYDQPGVLTSKSGWGIRDMTSGSVLAANHKFIYGSCERSATGNRVFAFDVTKNTTGNTNRSKGWTPTADWKCNGVAAGVSTIRGLAFHPIRKTMFSANFSSDVVEFNQAGVQKNQWTTRPGSMATYGMGYCDTTQNIIAVGQAGSQRTTDGVVAYVFDPGPTATSTFVDTGVRFVATDVTISGSKPGGVAGGCELIWETRKIPTLISGVTNKIRVPVLYCMLQATSDSVVAMYGKFQHNPYSGATQSATGNSGGDIGMGGGTTGTARLGNASFAVSLRNSTAKSAVLYASIATGNAAAPWISPGSTLQLNAGAAAFIGAVSAPQAVSGGKATATLPIPATPAAIDGVSVFFQWLEIGGSAPVLSNMGGVTIRK